MPLFNLLKEKETWKPSLVSLVLESVSEWSLLWRKRLCSERSLKVCSTNIGWKLYYAGFS